MPIRLETSRRTGIKNTDNPDAVQALVATQKAMTKSYPGVVWRTDASAAYNCHGLTFAARRTWILEATEIDKILRDDGYEQVELASLLPGDIVLYRSETGSVRHSGVVVEVSPVGATPVICSKWGACGEAIHGLYNRPQFYGPSVTFHRCRL